MKLDLGGTIKKPAQRSSKTVVSDAAKRTKALTVKFTPEEYKALQLYAINHDTTHQNAIHSAVMWLIK